MTAVRSVIPEVGGYVLVLDDGRELRLRLGDPRGDVLIRSAVAFIEANPGTTVEIGDPDAA